VPARQARAAVAEIAPGDVTRMFAAPRWLRGLGRISWLLVGVAAILVGVTWILGLTSSIVEPVVTGAVVAAVCAPGVAWLARRGVPRAAGAGLMLLALIAIAVGIFLLVIGGIVEQSAQIEAAADKALATIEGWVNDADANGTSGTAQDVKSAVSGAGDTLLEASPTASRGSPRWRSSCRSPSSASSSCSRTGPRSSGSSTATSGCRSQWRGWSRAR
jgi:hypothetical protein